MRVRKYPDICNGTSERIHSEYECKGSLRECWLERNRRRYYEITNKKCDGSPERHKLLHPGVNIKHCLWKIRQANTCYGVDEERHKRLGCLQPIELCRQDRRLDKYYDNNENERNKHRPPRSKAAQREWIREKKFKIALGGGKRKNKAIIKSEFTELMNKKYLDKLFTLNRIGYIKAALVRAGYNRRAQKLDFLYNAIDDDKEGWRDWVKPVISKYIPPIFNEYSNRRKDKIKST